MGTLRITLSQQITEMYVLSFFEGTKTLCVIELGTIEDEAREKADLIMTACQHNETYDDQT